MAYQADIEIDLSDHITSNYIISSQHRRTGNSNKSLWIIDFEAEVLCFIDTVNNNWIEGCEAWGLKIENATLQVVGVLNNRELKLAKFVDGTNSNVWHGYPADHMTKSQDRPTTGILKSWVTQGFISKAKMNKIRQGQLCYL